MKISRSMAAIASMTVALIALASPANADPWPVNPYFHPDEKPAHSHCFFDGDDARPGPTMRDITDAAMNYMQNATDANKDLQSPCVVGGTSQTDIVFRMERIFEPDGEESIGDAQCMAYRSVPGITFCNRFRVRINVPLMNDEYPNNTTFRDRQMRKTICHEVGHTLGLNHYRFLSERTNDPTDTQLYNLSCQRSGFVGHIPDAWTRQWEAHHISHINNWF